MLIGEAADRAARSGHPGPPLLVEHLLEARGAYYLVPWIGPEGIEIVIRIDASSAEFLGLAELSRPGATRFLSADDALARAKVEGSERAPPRCVWRPCRQSTTPFLPFYEVPHGGGTLYVDINGVVHRRLTDLGRGGRSG